MAKRHLLSAFLCVAILWTANPINVNVHPKQSKKQNWTSPEGKRAIGPVSWRGGLLTVGGLGFFRINSVRLHDLPDGRPANNGSVTEITDRTKPFSLSAATI
jgi:hypothetical protein